MTSTSEEAGTRYLPVGKLPARTVAKSIGAGREKAETVGAQQRDVAPASRATMNFWQSSRQTLNTSPDHVAAGFAPRTASLTRTLSFIGAVTTRRRRRSL